MKELDATQVEQLKTIGTYLGRERQEKGVSLEEIAVKTYIPLRLLQALEDGNIERLPEPVFVQGFIRRFADAIGLDGMALSKTFSPQESFMVERKAEEVGSANAVAQTPAARHESVERAPVEPIDLPPQFIQREPAPPAERSLLPWMLVSAAAVLLVGVGVFSVLNRSKPAIEPPTAETTAGISPASPSSPSLSPAPATSSSPQPSGNPSPTVPAATDAAPAANSPIQVAVNLTDESWFQVIADGKTVFEGILKKGEQKTWTAQKALVLEAGNAGAVSLSYNQGESKRMGAPGEVKDAKFPPTEKPKPGTAN